MGSKVGVIKVGEDFIWSSRENVQATGRWLTVHQMVTTSGTYGGKLPAVQRCQRPDRGKLGINIDRITSENKLVISPQIAFRRYPKLDTQYTRAWCLHIN